MKSYNLKIGNIQYLITGLDDLMQSPPSARGFSIKVYESGVNEYTTIYTATENNGYGFILYAEDDVELILKGDLGSDHKQNILNTSPELLLLKNTKYKDQDDMTFLRKTCVSGRRWMVTLNNIKYHFVSLWNINITVKQKEVLSKYLLSFPTNRTYIQMGLLSSPSYTKFTLVSGFVPNIRAGFDLSKKQTDFLSTLHTRSPFMPPSYTKQLKKLSEMTDFERNKKFIEYAQKALRDFEKLKHYRGKDFYKLPKELRYLTQSYVNSILIGLGRGPENQQLKDKLQSILPDVLSKEKMAKYKIFENIEMSKSDVNKIIKYSNEIQSMFDVNDNLEDWIKAKLNHAADYVMTVRDYIKFYRDEKNELREIKNKYKKDDIDNIVDGLQYALDILGIEPTIGTVADATNSIISILRAALEKETDNKKKHLLNAAISAVSMIPFGDLVKLIKLRVLRKPAVKLAKFIKQFLKSTDPSYADDMLEVWSNKYKKSINCNDPKGFSQKAHCRARKLRQSGKSTKSKSVKETYKQAIVELLKEYNSSMAMGALKQINSDAQELQSLLNTETHLEDWVKAKLNLAGEYLDDVYHHLDHFKSNTNEGYYDDKEKERLQRSLRFSTSIGPKKYWITPDGEFKNAEGNHERWIVKNTNVKQGSTLVGTYENAIKQGYIRVILDDNNFLMLSNLKSYDFSFNGSQLEDVPVVDKKIKNVIKQFVLDNDIQIVASGRGGKLINLDEDVLNENWKTALATTALAASTALGSPKVSQPVQNKPAIQQVAKSDLRTGETDLLNRKLYDYISHWEGKRNSVYTDTDGKPTIGIGHHLTGTDQDKKIFGALFGKTVNYDDVLSGKQKLTDAQVEKLFNFDVKSKEKYAASKIPDYNSFPQPVKNAIINALYRGDLGPSTIKKINDKKWKDVSKEYLNHTNAKTGPDQIKRRMKTNAHAFDQYAKEIK